MNEKYRHVFAVKKPGMIAGCAKIPQYRRELVILAELMKQCCILVGGKHYSPDYNVLLTVFAQTNNI